MKFEKRQRFAIRKFSVGVASVLVGQFFVGSMINAPQVNASELKSEKGVEANKVVEEEPTKEVTSEEISVPEPYRAPATLVEPTTENDATVVSTTESTTEVTVKETEKTTAVIAPSTTPVVEEKPELKLEEKDTSSTDSKVTEAKVAEVQEKATETKATEAKPEMDDELQPLKEQLNNSIIEAKAISHEAEKYESELDNSEAKKVLSEALEISKNELATLESLAEKGQLTKTELKSNIERLQSAIESVYTEMKRAGHSGFVSYMLAGATGDENTRPYMTIENYSGYTKVRNNGITTKLVYKMGLTRITSDEVDLTPDAKALGLTYDKAGEYVTGDVILDGRHAGRKYEIGLVSKTDPSVKATMMLEIVNPNSFGLSTIGDANTKYGIYPGSKHASAGKGVEDLDMNPNRTGDLGENYTGVINYTIPTTPFGYYIPQIRGRTEPTTVADAKPDSTRYFSELGLYLADSGSFKDFPDSPVTIKKFERLDSTPEVEYELVTISDLKGTHFETWDVHDGHFTPYRVRFTKLPAQQGTFDVKFKVTDSVGQVRTFNLKMTTEERSQSNREADPMDGYALTNADVMFKPNTETATLNKEGIVSVPRSDAAQTIGKLELNKVNATIKPVRFPDGTEYDEATQTIRKKAGAKLAPGKYNFEVRAIDGHFGDNAPNRIFQFEVTDFINPIDHQVWKEGERFTGIPVTLDGGSTIANIRVTTDSGDTYASLSGDSITKTVEGYGVLKTTKNQTARVEVDYYNADGGLSTTFTTFTFEVQPRDGV